MSISSPLPRESQGSTSSISLVEAPPRARRTYPAWAIGGEPLHLQRRIKIVECGEPLVSLREVCPQVALDISPEWVERMPTALYLRRTPAEMLARAAATLPPGYTLRVWWAHRSLWRQARGYWRHFLRLQRQHPEWTMAMIRRRINQVSHPPDVPYSPPGHCCGAAVDVGILGPDGKQLDFVSPLKDRGRARFTDVPGLSPEAQRNRGMLREAMTAGGFTNYRGEWWHWSYGDVCWALRAGVPTAMYGLIAPRGTLDELDVTANGMVLRLEDVRAEAEADLEREDRERAEREARERQERAAREQREREEAAG
jgi:D-alanyl-D-alanine dipeptidase